MQLLNSLELCGSDQGGSPNDSCHLSLSFFYLVNIVVLQQRNGKDIITEKLNVMSLCEADPKAPITLS